MNKQSRYVYRQLLNEVDFSLCAFCKFAECSGSSCCEAELECHHPLEHRFAFYEEILEPNDDCWGFRPSHPIPFIADIVGVVLQNKWVGASWWLDNKGIWNVAGAPY